MTGIIRVALFARVSSQQQADADTIDSQTHAILERIRGDGLRVDPDCMFCDDGYSGQVRSFFGLHWKRFQNVNNESNLNELVRRVGQVRSRIDRLIDAYESEHLSNAV